MSAQTEPIIMVEVRTWWSPPRSAPSLQPQHHSVHHRTSGCSSDCVGATTGGAIGSGGRLAWGVSVRGGGDRGRGKFKGCGGVGFALDNEAEGWSVFAFAAFGVSGDCSPSSNGFCESDAVMMAECWGSRVRLSVDWPGVAKGLSTGSGVTTREGPGLTSMSSSGTESESVVRSLRWAPTPPDAACFAWLPGHKRLARRAMSVTMDELPDAADSRAAFRRSRSAVSHFRRFFRARMR